MRKLAPSVLLAVVGACLGPVDATGPTVLWQSPGELRARPVIGDSLVVAGFTDGRVTAFVRESGVTRWSRKFPGPLWGLSLVVWEDKVVVPEFDLRAVSLTNGTPLWTYSGIDGRSGINTPVVSGDTVYVADYGGGAAALDIATGTPYWSVTLPGAAFGPTLAGEVALFSTRAFLGGPGVGPLGAGDLFALDRATGEERWRFSLPDSAGFPNRGGASNSGLVIGDVVIIGTWGGRIHAISLADGELQWERTTGHPMTAYYSFEPVAFGGAVVQTRSDGLIEAFSALNGNTIWELPTLGLDGHAPVPCGPYLCIGHGRLKVIGSDGNIVWADGGGTSGRTYTSAPIVDDEGHLYVGSRLNGRDSFIRALRLPPHVAMVP